MRVAETEKTQLDLMIEKARKAHEAIEFWSQDQVDEMVAAVGWNVYKLEHAEACAKLAFEETEMGVYKDKLGKHQKKILGTLRDIHGVQTVGIVEKDDAKGLFKVVKPVGVIGALTPVTNPTSTVGVKALHALKTRNAVIFAPHPKAKKNCALTVKYIREALQQVGAPVDLIQSIEEPSKEGTAELMQKVDLVLATGGPAMVKAAYSSGTPAYGVGAGNATIVVDETADIEDAANKIFLSKTFDNATSCSAENSVVVQSGVYDALVAALKEKGGYLCTAEEKAKLKDTIWPDGSHLNGKIVAQSALKIAEMAGLAVPETTRFIMVEGTTVGKEDMFTSEKLSPVMTLWKFGEFFEAVDYVNNITGFVGLGHSAGIHTTKPERIEELATRCKVSRLMVRQPQCYANSGNYDNGMPFTLTLGCGTWGGNITNDNVTWKNLVNYTWVSSPIKPVVPNQEEIFGAYWAKYGK